MKLEVRLRGRTRLCENSIWHKLMEKKECLIAGGDVITFF